MSEAVADYSRCDFRSYWSGRAHVTELERRLLERTARSADLRRTLDLGTGFGRLLPPLVSRSRELVVSDYNLRPLEALDIPELGKAPEPLRVAANLLHLPFAPGTFTFVNCVRVLHHIPDPSAALREIARVVVPGGQLWISYSPRPSFGTLANDVRAALRGDARPPGGWTTFAGGDDVPVATAPHPIYAISRARFAEAVRAAGWELRGEVGAGLEDFRGARFLPVGVFERVGRIFARTPGFPTRFARLERRGVRTDELPEFRAIFQCPRCGLPWSDGAPPGWLCRRCGFRGTQVGKVADLRYVPGDGEPGVRQSAAAESPSPETSPASSRD